MIEIRLELIQTVYSKTGLKRPHKKKTKTDFLDRLSLNAGEKYCRMLQESILQYFQPSLSYRLSLRPLFCLFLSGRLSQVLLYMLGPKSIPQTYNKLSSQIAETLLTTVLAFRRVLEQEKLYL